MKNILTIIIAVVASVAAVKFTSSEQQAVVQKEETAYERVMRTGKIRCGYGYWEPAIYKNEKTGEFEGFYPDLMKEIAFNSGLKVEFTSEVAWANVSAALETGKIDVMCAGMWQSGTKAKQLHFSTPITYQGVEAFVRADDTRFDADVFAANSEEVTLAVIDNDNSAFIAQTQFAKAKTYSLPVGAADTELLLALAAGKADMTFGNAGVMYGYMQANPSQIKRVDPQKVLRVFGNTLVTEKSEYELAHFLDVMLAELLNSGVVDNLIQKYEPMAPHTFMPVSKPYTAQ